MERSRDNGQRHRLQRLGGPDGEDPGLPSRQCGSARISPRRTERVVVPEDGEVFTL
jgi:hypothetical protein